MVDEVNDTSFYNILLKLPQWKENGLMILESVVHLSNPASPGRPIHSFKVKLMSSFMQDGPRSVNQSYTFTSVY